MLVCICMFGVAQQRRVPFYGGAWVGPCPPDAIRNFATAGKSSQLRPFPGTIRNCPHPFTPRLNLRKWRNLQSATRSETARRIPNPAFGRVKLHYAGTQRAVSGLFVLPFCVWKFVFQERLTRASSMTRVPQKIVPQRRFARKFASQKWQNTSNQCWSFALWPIIVFFNFCDSS